jgi:hypothetical protein
VSPTMPDFDWAGARSIMENFGGVRVRLHVNKTGLPFYDVLRLYGAIDLYVGTREDVCILDCGDRWEVSARARRHRLGSRDIAAFRAVRTKKMPPPNQFCDKLRDAITSGTRLPRTEDPEEDVPTDEQARALDPVLQSGIRGVSPAEYESMNSTSKPQCAAKIPLSDAVLAYAGLQRTETIGDMQFLPVFEGRIDLAKIVCPLRAWLNVPNPLCAEVLMLLSLKSALWSEGYSERLSAVTYSKKTQRTSFNYSGIIRIDSTAIGRIDDGVFCGVLYKVFRRMVAASWKNKKVTPMATHTQAMAEWLLQPLAASLCNMISGQEFLLKTGDLPFLLIPNNVRKVFQMTYPNRKIDHEAVRKLAKTVSSAIYTLGPKEDPNKRRQHWYNEVVALRNAPTKESFRHKVLTIIEQGRADNSWVEKFEPAALLESMGDGRSAFEEFRDCFRMYLIQESAPRDKALRDVGDAEPGEEEEKSEQ